MTKKSQFLIPRGSEFRVGLSTDALTLQKRKDAGLVKPPQINGVIKTDDEDDLYVFRKPGGFAFFDLGTRLRSVPALLTSNELAFRSFPSTDTATPNDEEGYYSEYVEQLSEVRGVSSVASDTITKIDEPTDEEWEYITRVMLGSRAPELEDTLQDVLDPLGKSTVNGSTRVVSNSAQFSKFLFEGGGQSNGEVCWFNFPKDDELVPAGVFPDWNPRVQLFTPPYPEKTFPEDLPPGVFNDRESKLADADERWNTYNMDSESGLAQNPMQIDSSYFKQFEGRHLFVGRLSHFSGVAEDAPPDFMEPDYTGGWYGFYTKDLIQFKITNEPLFASDEVEYRFKIQDEIYLIPVPFATSLAHAAFSVVFFHSRWVNKAICLYPTRQGTMPTGDTDDQNIPWVKRSPLAEADTAGPDDRALTTRTSTYNFAREGSLIAMIKRGNKVFYIWSRIDMVKFLPE